MTTIKNMPPALKAALFFLLEAIIGLYILIRPDLLEAFLLIFAKHVFASCLSCLVSPQFLISSALLLFLLFAHLIRFLIFDMAGNSLLAGHKSSAKELLISLLICVAYLVFLMNSLTSITIEKNYFGIFDVVNASVAALALIVILLSVFFIFVKKEK